MRELYTPENMAGQPYHIADGSLTFLPDKVFIQVRSGEKAEGSIIVRGREEDPVRGFVSSSGLRMRCGTGWFSTNPDRITWQFDASSMRDGTREDGFFRILSNRGEYMIPFEVEAVEERAPGAGKTGVWDNDSEANGLGADGLGDPAPGESGFAGEGTGETGPAEAAAGERGQDGSAALPSSQARFYRLAQRDWAGAVRYFYQDAFGQSLHNSREQMLWRGLRAHPQNEQNVEEYLIAAYGKKPAKFSVNISEIRREFIGTAVFGSGARGDGTMLLADLFITREGWGFTQLDMIRSGDFWDGKAVRLTRDDFLDDVLRLPLRIDAARLHAGRNFGRITLRSPWQTIEIPVEIHCRQRMSQKARAEQESERLLLKLMRSYEQLRLGGLGEGEWLRQTGEILRRLSLVDRSGPLPGLYYAHLMLMQGRGAAAIRELEAVRRKLAHVPPGEVLEMGYTRYEAETDVMYAYRQFLTAAAYKDDEVITPRVVRILHDRYRKNPGDWRIAWLLLQISKEYEPGSAARGEFLQRQFLRGARSPILYLEAWEIISADPSLLCRRGERSGGWYAGDPFGYHLLLYALRRNLVTEEVISAVIEAAERYRGFSMPLFAVLSQAYDKDSLQRRRPHILAAVCGMLIRGGVTGPDWFPWYSRAVERGLSAARLEDGYLQSLPEDHQGRLPDSVLRRCTRAQLLPVRAKAAVYRFLYENRTRYPALYEDCLPAIRAYLESQLREGRMSRDLAFLYCCEPLTETFTRQQRERLHRLSYACQLRTTRTDLPLAVVVYAAGGDEHTYRMTEGNCILPVFGEDNCIFFEDRDGCRYAASVPYTLDRLMDPGDAVTEKAAGPDPGDAGVSREDADPETDTDIPVREEQEASPADISYLLEVTGAAEKDFAVTEDTAAQCEILVRSEALASAFRARLQLRLLRYYAAGERLFTEKCRAIQHKMDPADFGCSEQSEVTEVLVDRGLFSESIRWLSACGEESVPVSVLTKLCKGLSGRPAGRGAAAETDRVVSVLAMSARSRGETDPAVTAILLGRAELFSEEISGIIREEKEKDPQDLSSRDLISPGDLATPGDHISPGDLASAEQRLLRQRLFTGQLGAVQGRKEAAKKRGAPKRQNELREHAAVIADAIARGGEFRETGLTALEQYCACVFADHFPMDAETRSLIRQMGEAPDTIPDIAKLAFLKEEADGLTGQASAGAAGMGAYAAGRGSAPASGRDSALIGELLRILVGKGIVFPFFRSFDEAEQVMRPYRKETMLEYCDPAGAARSSGRVVIHYAHERGGKQEPFEAREMTQMARGFYASSFLLFCGEQLHYFITDDAAEKNITESGTIGPDPDPRTGAEGEQEGRFGRLEALSKAITVRDRGEVLQLAKDYRRQEYLVRTLFSEEENGGRYGH